MSNPRTGRAEHHAVDDWINRGIEVTRITFREEFHRTEVPPDVDTNQRLVDVIQSTDQRLAVG